MKKLVLAFFVLFAVLISICNTVFYQSTVIDNAEEKIYVGTNLSMKAKVTEALIEEENEY